MNAFRHMLLLAFTTIFLFGCGTEDSLTGDATATTTPTPGTVAQAASILLTADATQINSGTGDVVTLTAIVKDANNLLLEGAIVVFSSPLADNADIIQSSTTTDSSGLVTATVASLDPTNRTITVTATVDGISTSQTINVTGTTVTISGTSNLAFDQQTNLTISLTDSTGTGINAQTVTLALSNASNTLSSSSVTTDTTGQATVTLTAAANDTITATALGATTSFAITVSSDSFAVSMPSEINIDTCTAVTATWTSGGIGVAGETITFLTSRGAFYSDAGSCSTPASAAATNAAGVATLYIQSANPGPFTVTADATAAGGPASTASSEFIATVPAVMTLQADDTTIGINDTVTLTATVSDSQGNLVKNAMILFNIDTDTTGGSISPTSDVTDSQGRAQTVYSSTSTVSSTNGITIKASVSGYAIEKTIDLTVSGTATSIIVGLANKVLAETSASYAYPGTVLVVDSGGNPVKGAAVDIKLVPTYYDKGRRTRGTGQVWFATSSITGTYTGVNLACQSEDTLTGLQQYDLNGTLDSEDTDGDGIIDITEDRNNNGVLDPSGVATVETDLVTNDSGYAIFNVRYPKNNAGWAQVRLIVTARTATSESTKNVDFVLVVLADDVTANNNTEIVGATSPWGDGGVWVPETLTDVEYLLTPTDCVNNP